MNLRRWLLIIVFLLFPIFAPVPQQGGPSGVAFASSPPAFSAHELPCAEVGQRYIGDALKVVYKSPSIYNKGAVLPKMEGLACLDVLADWLISAPQTTWKVSVGSETGTGFESQALTNKRQELLKRYFLRKGIDTSGWKWQSGSRHHQLRLNELKGSP